MDLSVPFPWGSEVYMYLLYQMFCGEIEVRMQGQEITEGVIVTL
jgi:hypothetical protein